MDGYYTVSVAAILETLFVLELGSNKVAVALSLFKVAIMFYKYIILLMTS
jgi:hypothetical protein